MRQLIRHPQCPDRGGTHSVLPSTVSMDPHDEGMPARRVLLVQDVITAAPMPHLRRHLLAMLVLQPVQRDLDCGQVQVSTPDNSTGSW